MIRTNSNNGPGQSAGQNKKLKPASCLKKKEAIEKKNLAAISQKMLKEKLNVETFGDVIIEVRKRRIAQPFVKKSWENYHEAISIALAFTYVVQTKDDPIAALE